MDGSSFEPRAVSEALGGPAGGGAERDLHPSGPQTCSIDFTNVVLPKPDPPMMTSTLLRRASPRASRWLGACVQEARPELQAVAAVVDPTAREPDPLADGAIVAAWPTTVTTS